MEQGIIYKVIDTTEDTGDPVIRMSMGNSNMTVILVRDEEAINVYSVDTEEPGHMKKMLDEIISQVKYDWVQFLVPLEGETKDLADRIFDEAGLPERVKFSSDDNNRNIRDVLDGFKEVEEEINGQEIPMLVGFWDTDK